MRGLESYSQSRIASYILKEKFTSAPVYNTEYISNLNNRKCANV